MSDQIRLFSWELSYFSGKVRAYLRYKDHFGALGAGYEDILCSYDLILNLLAPNTGSVTVPQVLLPDGTWVHDSSEIIDVVERRHPETPIHPDPRARPRQSLASYLVELLADEWMVVWAFWERWHHCQDGVRPSQLAFNQQQWGSAFAPAETGLGRRAAGATMFDGPLGVKDSRTNVRGVYAGLRDLGMTEKTQAAWTASTERILDLLEAHFDEHDFLLGGRPCLGDFGLMGPLYAHLYRDPVPGYDMRLRHPLVAQWVERTNGTNALDARSYNQRLYSLENGELVGRPATSHGGEWLADDGIPDTLVPLLAVFFEEMWPVLDSTIERTTAFIASEEHERGAELPAYTFHASPGFEAHQQSGALSHRFTLGGVEEQRMVVPYHLWMLQRLADPLRASLDSDPGRTSVRELLESLPGGTALLELDDRLSGCRVRKEGGRIFSVA